MSQSQGSVVTIVQDKDNKMKVNFLGDAIISGAMNTANNSGKMGTFAAYYGKANNTKYTVEGSIIGCTYGLEKTRIGIVQDHAVSHASGNPVLTCSDYVAGENVYSFGICYSPNLNFQLAPKTTITCSYAHVQPSVMGPKCMLALKNLWFFC